MTERNGIERVVERVVSQVLDRHIPRLREELVQQVLGELEAQLGTAGEGLETRPADLLRAISLIHAGSTQREILRALLDGAVQYCGRAALFVIKSGTATGWQARGFLDSDSVKDFHLDVSRGLAQRALEERAPARGSASEIDSRFTEQFGTPTEPRVLVLPLMLKDKVAALVYADAGQEAGTRMDSASLELLVTSTSAWLEVASLRKQAPRDSGTEAAGHAERTETVVPVQAVSSFSDPFAGHAPKHVMTSAAPAEVESAPVPVAESSVAAAPHDSTEAADVPVMAMAAAATAGTDAMAGLAPEDAEMHRKAQRFAKLLVDEIKLYNQAKVAEGRKNKDLYDRLKEDIEKSRATYQKRYGNTVAASGGYFIAEVIRSLAEDDLSIMGANFRR